MWTYMTEIVFFMNYEYEIGFCDTSIEGTRTKIGLGTRCHI